MQVKWAKWGGRLKINYVSEEVWPIQFQQKCTYIHIRCRSSQITSRPLNEVDLHVPVRSRLVILRKIYRGYFILSKNKPLLMEYKWENAVASKRTNGTRAPIFTAERRRNWSLHVSSRRTLKFLLFVCLLVFSYIILKFHIQTQTKHFFLHCEWGGSSTTVSKSAQHANG